MTTSHSHFSFLVSHLSVWQVAALPILACKGVSVANSNFSKIISWYLFNDDSLYT
jgi:hypothetical protein